MLLNVPVKITKKAYFKLFADLHRSGYPVVAKEATTSLWIGDVCVAENRGGYWVYPAAFARYSK